MASSIVYRKSEQENIVFTKEDSIVSVLSQAQVRLAIRKECVDTRMENFIARPRMTLILDYPVSLSADPAIPKP